MFKKNKELRWGVLVIAAASALLTAVGFWISTACGVLVLASCLVTAGIHLVTEGYRYRRLRRLSRDLDELLVGGKPLPIGEYEEGELSILADQIGKMTRMLTESAEAVRNEKGRLADSLADISHQLRTPLTAMNLTAAMLRGTELTPENRTRLTGELLRLLDRTDWLVETLLKLSRLDAGTVKLAKEPVRVRELIHRAAAPIAIAMELRNQQLSVHCGDEHFLGDRIWSAEALGNILKNAMEHTPEGGTVTVTVRDTALFTQLEIEDTGPGFAKEEIPHLFERFYKGSNASETSYGIGLNLARTVIVAQNGTVQAMNGSTGAKFVVRFYKQVV